MSNIDTARPSPLRLSKADEDSIEEIAIHLQQLLGSGKPSKTAVIKIGLRVTRGYFEEVPDAWKIALPASLISTQSSPSPDPRLMSFRISPEYREIIDWLGVHIMNKAIEEVPRLSQYLHSAMGDVQVFRVVCAALLQNSKRYAGNQRLIEAGKIVQEELKGSRGQF